MKKRIVAIALFAVMVMSSLLPVGAAGTVTEKKSFIDVKRGEWYYDEVMLAAERGILSGYLDGTFRPDAYISVEEFASMVIRVCGIPLEKSTGYKSYWAEEYVKTADKYFIIQKIELELLEKLELTDDITRQMAITALMRAVTNKKSLTYDPNNQMEDNGVTSYDLQEYFTDGMSIKFQHISPAKFAKLNGYVTGDEKGAFNPLSNLTRAEAAVLINKAYTEPKEPVPPQVLPEIKTELVQLLWNTGRYAETNWPYPMYCIKKDGTKDGIKYDEMSFDKKKDSNGNITLILYLTKGHYKPAAIAEVLEMFKVVFPTQYKEAYNTFMSVMREEIFEDTTHYYGASAVRYYDNRMLAMQFFSANSLYTGITISEIKAKEHTQIADWTKPNQRFDDLSPIGTMKNTIFEDGTNFRNSMFTVTNTPDKFVDLP